MRIGVNEEQITHLGKAVATAKGGSFIDDERRGTGSVENVFATGALHSGTGTGTGILGSAKF